MNIPDKCQRGYIRIDLNAIRTNINNLHSLYPPHTQILAVIKTNGYGHGAVETGLMLEGMDCVFGFCVATPEEAFELRISGIKKPLLVMGYVFPYAYEQLINEDISFILFRDDTLIQLEECAVRLGKKASVHIEVDTGMNRLGIRPDDEGFSFIRKIVSSSFISLDGIYTHFARADETEKESTLKQLDKFMRFVSRIESGFSINIPYKHSSNSAGMLGYRDYPLSLCRPGISIYGIWPSEEAKDFSAEVDLVPALSLYSQIVMLKDCPPGEAVSYGGTYITARPAKIATVPLGYGDGYPRSLSNIGYVLIRGQKAPVVGRVCMDFFMVDVTDISGARLGDRVTLLGVDGGLRITAEEVGLLSGRFPYELVCDFAQRIPRIYI